MVATAPDQPDSNGAAEEETSGKGAGGQQPAGQYMGFGALLRRWRRAAGVTQPRAAKALGMGERTYRKIEKGATPPRLTPAQCESLATLLGLDREERHALLLYNIGSNLIPPRGANQPELQQALRLLIDRQMPSPAYLCDRYWNILGFNTAMAEWWPWVMEPGANLILWALTSPEARTQYQDWDMHASAYVKILKFAEATKPDDAELRELIEKVKKDPDVRHVWETEHDMGETRDGHVFRMNVPALDWETVEVVSHVLYPASMPECRFVVITWVEGGEDERDALGGARNAWAATTANQDDVEAAQRHAQNRVAEDAATRWRREAAALASRMVVANAEDAAALAGENSIPMPAISKVVGPNAQLTLAPDQRTVVWAVEETAGCWSVTHVSPATVIARVPREAVHGACLDEILQLVRAALPAEADAAAARIGELLEERDTEQRVLREVLHMIEGRDCGERDTREAGQEP
ncbi:MULTISPECIES: helix-turn-helix transcriptional regulator [unclassified Streptomyces]|uniref:helix-turn-helix transcriptional regulator n=1 Tax=unclassified Streptomyces TaxID=2593676 RepID=UPI00082388FD|nr:MULTISPECIES: helix-turn-helix transcriptional regulator [unclassified Streptomyces]SCK61547.1 Helix-turn-helix domain-containing protein [Streptomyces sp. AmelKG-D3]